LGDEAFGVTEGAPLPGQGPVPVGASEAGIHGDFPYRTPEDLP